MYGIAVWSISGLGPFCRRVLSDCAVTEYHEYDLTPTGKRGKLYEKIFFTFDFHILPEQRRIGDKNFPCRCISIKNGDQPWGRCWPIYLGPVWLDQNWNWFQNPLRLFRPDFLKPNPDSWNHETSPGARFIGFKMADADGQVSGGNFRQFVLSFHNPQFHNKKLVKQHNDILIKFVRIKLINNDIWIKNRSRFYICFRETGFRFNILFVYNLMVSESGF